ncbi:MAG: ATP-grasp domain-containing protein [Pseudomonadota bacterium]
MTAKPCALITLGRMPKGLDVARALTAAGCRVIVAEPFGWHLAATSRAVAASFQVRAPASDKAGFLQDLSDIIRREAVDLVVPVSEESSFVACLAGSLPEGTRLLCAPEERLLALHDKAAFAVQARSLGLGVPETHPLGSAGAQDLAERQAVVVKPTHACAGSGVSFHAPGDTLPSIPGCIVQARLTGREFSSVTLAEEGRVLGTVVYEGLLMSGSVAVAFERQTEAQAVEEWIARFVAETGHSGFIGFDFIQEPGKPPMAIECNPRITSGVHFFDPAWLARALMDPQAAPPVVYRSQLRLQIFWQCLAEMYGAMARLNGRRYRQVMRTLFTSKDVLARWRDPWPFWLMTFTSWPILRRALFQGMTLGEAATCDIVWQGGETITTAVTPARESAP